jgi:gluconate 5-dehydrogenase
MKDLFNVANKVVLITGSSRGIGLSFANGFAEAGAKVVINGRDETQVNQVVQEIDGNVKGYAFDVCDQAAVKKGISKIEAEVGPIDVLINNAGIQRRAPLEELSLEDWNAVINVI